jgi:pimeloyl-ACP methyl ester carboxylesterase
LKIFVHNLSKWIGYLFIGLAFLTGAGALYQFMGGIIDKRNYPPPGRLVNIGTHRLHLLSMGEGNPAVIMESGSGSIALDWCLVQLELAHFTGVYSYDRAGSGWSDQSPNPRTIPQIVEELHTLLTVAKIHQPYILVGHSLGGLYIQYYARRYPAEVAGMVLVDSMHPDLFRYMPPTFNRKQQIMLRIQWLASISGILRFGYLSTIPPDKMPFKIQRMCAKLRLRPSYWTTLIDQNKHLGEEVAENFRNLGPFPDIPLIVLTPRTDDWTSFISPQFPALWLKAQKDLVKMSPKGRLVILDGTSHTIPFDRPDVVCEEVRSIIAEVYRDHK